MKRDISNQTDNPCLKRTSIREFSLVQSHYSSIYCSRGLEYEELISYEDYAGNLLRTLLQLVGEQSDGPLKRKVAADLGCGTGRLSRLLSSHLGFIFGFDAEPHMVAIAQKLTPVPNVCYAVSEHARIPLASQSTDLVVEGWAFLHTVSSRPDTWRSILAKYLDEVSRVLRPGGMIVLVETLGTGHKEPTPTEKQRQFSDWLMQEHDFKHTSIRTDYEFPSIPDAIRICSSFFKEEVLERVRACESSVVPECTGIWCRVKQ
mmetsp:Transcript_113010/g.225027  ORF Transcript_113010/g.225027 Transcript_113010/m.225027 type:complete len:261 (-) Transcript_113010:4-786(-)